LIIWDGDGVDCGVDGGGGGWWLVVGIQNTFELGCVTLSVVIQIKQILVFDECVFYNLQFVVYISICLYFTK
jgi:hypothetical protein